MALRFEGFIELPAHAGPGGFDHAAVHGRRGLLYVAHTANGALDVIDCARKTFLRSIGGLPAVAGALVCEEQDLVFTSNRGEDTVGVFSPDREGAFVKVAVGVRPNGLAYAPADRLLLAANVGDPARAGSYTVSIVNVETRSLIADTPVAGRTRWSIFDPEARRFYVNVSDPPQIAIVEVRDPTRVAQVFSVPVAGPHGLDFDPESRRLFCAADAKVLVVLDARSGKVLAEREIGGVPDVVFFNAARRALYVAIGDPGVIEVFDTETLRRREAVVTEKGAHTLAFDASADTVYALLPETHRAAVYVDGD
jgi:DNA-binding beta-propeller fold protein YncE